MRIIMPSFEPLEWMPPTINLLKKLDRLGHSVVFITIYPCKFLETLNLENVTNVSLAKSEIALVDKIKYIKGVSGLLYRIDILIKKLICLLKLKKVINTQLLSGGYLWVVNEMTVMLGGKRFLKNKKYSFLIYELHERKFYARNIEYAAKNAENVIVPEYCRAHIMKSRYGLKKVPFVLPNKSDIEFDKLVLSEEGAKSVSKIKELKDSGNKVLVYMGGVGTERPLEPLLKSIRKIGNIKLAIIGRHSEYLGMLIKEYSDVLVYLNSFSPPEHLAVARYCDIGILNYVSINQKQGLNAIFCAPNKIYEYTGLGLPIIANDIPGLKFEVERGKCGKLVDYNDTESIKDAITCIFEDYDNYSVCAEKYYNSLDTDKILSEILNSINN